MGWLKGVLREAWALFVDDVGLALGAVLTIGLAAALHAGRAPDGLVAAALFLGLALSVLISVWRKAHRKG